MGSVACRCANGRPTEPMAGLSQGFHTARMLNPNQSSSSLEATTRQYSYLVVASVCLALIPIFWSSLDLSVARAVFSARDSGPGTWLLVQTLNHYTPLAFRTLLVFCAALWIASSVISRWKHLRLPLAFVVLAGIAGPGLAVNGIVKPLWERARPHQIVEFGGAQKFTQAGAFSEECSKNCSFVSGHAACGFFLSSLCLIFRKRRLAWMATGVLAGALIGFARIGSMDHWLSDVLWAFPVTLLSSWMVWWVLQRFAAIES
jgi:lipid A 4'-phosphatase